MNETASDNPYVLFREAHPSRADIVCAARLYIGVEYSKRGAYVRWNDDLKRWQGQLDCLRFLLHVARDVGYLDGDFDVNLSRPHPKLPLDQAMWEVLHANLDEVPKDSALPGDVFLMCYSDLNPDLKSAHHVGIKSSDKPFPYGSMIHCEDYSSDGSGGVIETRIDIKYWNRSASVWRLRRIVEVQS